MTLHTQNPTAGDLELVIDQLLTEYPHIYLLEKVKSKEENKVENA